MTTLREIEAAIKKLPEDERAQLREWLLEFDAASWDEQLKEDIASGKFDEHAEKALQEHRKNQTRQL